ncbi:protein phosphatase CheZ [Magnetospirillum aberrantis]|uniref:Protein phosphatase CheZ n=1 Tax=Magnetospirillum aberrantis SpK TaxID=908842 RepID=A0A7C9QVK9_9PROT|nr:protein phosphatase CheZ [Magnetospirillum aberrantis]NFV81219.1 protein phosphatase CheZ [Magnetospirillum aberrantis SpK]
MNTERKLFTAELQRLKALSAKGEPVAHPNVSGNGEVLKALGELRADIKSLEHLIKGEEAPPPSVQLQTMDDMVNHKQAEVSMLKTELRALAVCIEQTKQEIAALRPKDSQDDRLMAVTFELDAIVSATEGATQSILEAAEKIEGITKEIQSHGVDSYVGRLAEDINETIINIFEACNFQDITGQRITKVVKTLQYIEARINAMIDIWGPDNIADIVPKPATDHRDDDAKLLNGPALENQGISQDEIDKLFG